MFKRVKGFFKEMTSATLIKVQMLIIVLTCSVCPMMAQNTAGDYTAGTNALSTVAEENAFWLNHTQTKYDKMNIRLKKTRYK